jgi:hypothetical protein
MAQRSSSFLAGRGQADPLSIKIPAPKGGNFIPATERGPRPELPHKTYSEYEESSIDLSPQQKKENTHVTKQQNNWDAHKELEDAAALASVKAKKETEVDESQLSAEDFAALGVGSSGGHNALHAAHAALTDAHESMQRHVGMASEIVSKVRAASTAALNQHNEMAINHAAMRANKMEIPPEQVEKAEDLKSFVENSNGFSQRHLRATNRGVAAKSYLDKAEKLMSVNKTADAADVLSAAHRELSSMAKHLSSPITKLMYDRVKAVHVPVDTNSIDIAGSTLGAARAPLGGDTDGETRDPGGIGRRRGPLGEAPLIKIGKPGRLAGDKGSAEEVRADKDGLKYVTAKYGTLHEYTRKVKDAHVKWKSGRVRNASVTSIMQAPVESKEEIAAREAAAKAKAAEFAATPEQVSSRKSADAADELDFKFHMARVYDAIKTGSAIPGKSADRIGRSNVLKLITHHQSQQGEA